MTPGGRLSGAITDAIARGAGRVESAVLSHQYRHLFPLVGPTSNASEGTRKILYTRALDGFRYCWALRGAI